MAANERVFDELLSFLGDPIFQVPVRTFMDENSLIFDPSITIDKEHQRVHEQYKKLIDSLLEGFCQDAKISPEDAVAGISRMNQVPDLREVFHVLFEQVLAATDFEIFCQVMIKRNIMIQEQVLVMIISATGQVPAAFQSLAKKDGEQPEAKKEKPSFKGGAQDQEEESVLQQIMQKSKAEQAQADALRKQEEADLSRTLALSLKEAEALQESRHAMEQAMEKMVLEPEAKPTPASALPIVTPTTSASSSIKPKPAPSPASAAPPSVSGAQAANHWLQSAQAEASAPSSTHSALAASLSQLSPEELKKRQTFLSQQRDKLLAMKKEAREKQLGAATKSQPQRPQSARAARSAMNRSQEQKSPDAAEDQKKLAMRKAIADKLRQEVIGKE